MTKRMAISCDGHPTERVTADTPIGHTASFDSDLSFEDLAVMSHDSDDHLPDLPDAHLPELTNIDRMGYSAIRDLIQSPLLDNDVTYMSPTHIIDDKVRAFRQGCIYARHARNVAGTIRDNWALSSALTSDAYYWLHHEIFRKHYAQDFGVEMDVHKIEMHYKELSKAEVARIEQRLRNAFRSWMHSMMGSARLFKHVVVHGIFDVQMLTDYMKERSVRENEASREASSSQDLHPHRQ